MPSPTKRFAPWLVAGAAAAWGLIGIWGKQAQAVGVGPIEIGFWRAVIAGALFFVHARLLRIALPRGRDLIAIAIFGLVGVSFFYACYQSAVRLGGASLASVLQYSAPVFVAVLGWVILRERLGLREIIYIAICVIGVGFISLGGGSGVQVNVASVGVGLIAGFSYSLYYVFGRRFFARYNPLAVFSVMMPVGALGLLPFVSFHPIPASGWLNLLGLALVCTYLAYLVHSLGLRHIPAAKAAVIAATEPLSAAILAAIIFGEQLSTMALIGAVIVITSAIMLGQTKRPSAPHSPG